MAGYNRAANGTQKGKICSISWCETKRYAKGLCKMHYNRVLTGVDLEAPKNYRPSRPKKPCAFEGCDKDAATKGYCSGHNMQIYKGKELTPLIMNVAQSGEGRECAECGEWKTWDNYYKYKSRSRQQWFSRCIPCVRKKQNAERAEKRGRSEHEMDSNTL